MTNEQLKELADLRVAIQDLKYQLTQKHEEIEDRESAIYATGYYKGIEYKRLKDLSEDKESFVLHTFTCDCGNYWNLDKYPPRLIEKAKNETLDTKSYLIGKYDKLRELTDEEIHKLFLSFCNVGFTQVDDIGFARAIESYLKGKKFCNKCNNTGWVCEWHPDKEAHKCCGGAGMPCECTKESE